MRSVIEHGQRSTRTITGLLLLAVLAATVLSRADVAEAALARDYYELRARHSNKCLDVAHASTRHGAKVIQGDCRGSHNQQWALEPARSRYDYPAERAGHTYQNLYFRVVARHSKKCLDVAHGSRAHAANVIQGTCTLLGANQQWAFWTAGTPNYRRLDVPPRPNVYYHVMPMHNDTNHPMCLDVAHHSVAHLANVLQATCWHGYNQHWRLVWKAREWY